MARAVDLEQRAALFRQAEAILIADSAGIWVYTNAFFDAVHAEVGGIRPANSRGAYRYEEWYLKGR